MELLLANDKNPLHQKEPRGLRALMSSCTFFYHFKQNAMIRGEDGSQMWMFMDYLPEVLLKI